MSDNESTTSSADTPDDRGPDWQEKHDAEVQSIFDRELKAEQDRENTANNGDGTAAGTPEENDAEQQET